MIIFYVCLAHFKRFIGSVDIQTTKIAALFIIKLEFQLHDGDNSHLSYKIMQVFV